MPYTDTDDVALYYEVFGDADDPLVVLISGGGAQLLSWRDEFIALLVSEGLRVVRFDNRDTGLSARFGGSDDLDGGYDLADMGDDVVRILDSLEVDAAHLVGHSMGGMIAQMVAIDHPERVRSLGLLSTIPGRDPRYVLHAAPDVTTVPTRYPREVLVAGAEQFARSVGSSRYPIDVEWMAWAAGEAFDRGYAPEGFTRQWSALLRAPERLELLRRVTVPTFVFHGRDDDVLHWVSAVDIADALPAAELQVVTDVGHYLPTGIWPVLVDGIVRAVRAGEAISTP